MKNSQFGCLFKQTAFIAHTQSNYHVTASSL